MGWAAVFLELAYISYQKIWRVTESNSTFATSRSYKVEDFSPLPSPSSTREGVSDQTVCLEPYQYEPLT